MTAVENPSFSNAGTKSHSLIILGRILSVAIALALSAFLLYRLPKTPRDASHAWLFCLWALSIILFFIGIVPRSLPDFTKRIPTAIRNNSKLILSLIVLLLLAAGLRLWHLGSIPFALSGDEASYGTQSELALNGIIKNPFITGHLSQPTFIFFLGSIFIKLLGSSIFSIRLPWALIGIITIPITFLLVRRLQGTRMAYLTAALLALYHFHIHYSRLNIGNIADPFFGVLTLFFLDRALRKSNRLDWALAGVASGLSLYFYTGARFTLILAFMMVAYEVLVEKHRFFLCHRLRPIFGLLAFLIVAGPMLQHAYLFPDDFNGRINQMGIVQSGWLEQTASITGQSKAAIVWDQFRRAALAFNYYPDRTLWYGLKTPLLDPIFSAFFLLGLGYGMLRIIKPWKGDRNVFPMVFWCLGGMFLGGALTIDPPSSQRLVTLTVPACFFMAFGLDRLIVLTQRALPRFPATAALSIGILAFGIISWRTYFIECTGKRLYGGRHAEIATAIAPILNEAKEREKIFFCGAPALYWGFPTFPYLVKNAEVEDVMQPLSAPVAPDLTSDQRGAMYVFVPERASELQYVQAAFPQGRKMEVCTPVDNSVIALLYEIPPQRAR